MARIIRFPLKMKNGAEVRSLDELKENFDLESVIGYFADGMLQKWLSDRYYDEKAEAVAALSKESPDFNQKLCEILEVEYTPETDNIDLDAIQRRNEKYRILSTITADQDILNNIDVIALNQDDLYDILDTGSDKVYLYGERFEIPFGRKNIRYIGLNEPLVIIEKSKRIIDYYEAKIVIEKTKFGTSVSEKQKKINRCREIMGEMSFYDKISRIAFNQEELDSLVAKGEKEIYLFREKYVIDLSRTDIKYIGIDNPEIDGVNADISNPFPIMNIQGTNTTIIRNKIISIPDNPDDIYQLALKSRNIDNEKCYSLLCRAAESGHRDAMYSLAYSYEHGRGVKEDKNKAAEWYKRAYDFRHPFAKQDLERLANEDVHKAQTLLRYL